MSIVSSKATTIKDVELNGVPLKRVLFHCLICVLVMALLTVIGSGERNLFACIPWQHFFSKLVIIERFE